jgi:Zn-dependent protease
MIKPEIVSPGENVNKVGEIFETPLVTKGWTWLPLTELVVWCLMTREAGRLHPERSWITRMGVAALTMPVILGSEWCHNLAHAAAAKLVGHPADAIRITWGMPLLVYHDLEEAQVTPHQHIVRALGGPLMNFILFLIAAIVRPFSKPRSNARDIINAALGMNAFLILGGLLPIPGIDGGAALKWALVDQGQTPTQADETIRKVDAVVGAGLGAGAFYAFKERKRFLGAILAMFAGFALAISTGLLKEKA